MASATIESGIQRVILDPDRGEVWIAERGVRLTQRGRAVVDVRLLEGGPPVAPMGASSSPGLEQALDEITEYLLGKRRSFDLPLFVDGPPFFRRCWEELAKIPYGGTLSYGELALRAGSPGGARAVGAAMRANRLPLLIPCHRVVGAGGKLGGFSCGIAWKKHLLHLEGVSHGLDMPQ